MTRGRFLTCGFLTMAMAVFLFAGGIAGHEKGVVKSAVAPTANGNQGEEAQRIEGERRFRANCGRCHQTPHKFPPRMMATIIRHMRVRATITDEDMRLILQYMTQ